MQQVDFPPPSRLLGNPLSPSFAYEGLSVFGSAVRWVARVTVEATEGHECSITTGAAVDVDPLSL